MSDVVLLSGGLDSSTLLADAAALGVAGLALSVNYGQRHKRELAAAEQIALYYGVRHEILDLTAWGRLIASASSALVNPDVAVPHGHYADESMRATIVPNRNAVLLMAAVGVAEARDCDRVVTAVHAGDHPIYPDCRPAFVSAANMAAQLATEGRVSIEAPYVDLTKTDIARRAADLGVPVQWTWSCYEGGVYHCGKCGTCVERIEALRDAGWPDPTTYADPVSA